MELEERKEGDSREGGGKDWEGESGRKGGRRDGMGDKATSVCGCV